MTTNTNSEQWTYDNRGRVLTYSHSYNNALKASVSYQYDEFGRLKKKVYDNGKAEESFTWNLQGWNTGKQAEWGSSLIFSEDLMYYNPAKDTTLALYSGNISEAATKQQTGQLATNSYSYDGAGRLTNALLLLGDSQNPVTYNGMRNIQYDRNGNMTSNQTTDMGFNKLQSFSHSGNRLTAIQESFPQSTRPSSSATFAYDSRGNMSSDGRKGLLISYNILNLPEKVVKTDSTDMATFRYLYDGTKVAAVRSDGTSIRYQGAFVIDCSTTGFPSTIKSIAWADGVCAAKDGESGFGDYLNVKDHLGNVRDIVALYKADTTPISNVIAQKSDYMPFGQRISDMTSPYASSPFSATTATHRWHLGTKEEVPEGGLNLLDFGARYYDPELCRWTSVDPMAEKYYGVSPYNYCNDNPISFIDPTGTDGIKYQDENGNWVIETNVVVLVEKERQIPENATEKQRQRLERRNEIIRKNNEARVETIKQQLAEEFNGAVDEQGNPVTFVFNVTSLPVDNPATDSNVQVKLIAAENGIPVDTPNRLNNSQGYGVALAAVITTALPRNKDAKGETSGSRISLRDHSSRTLAHEMGHILGLGDMPDNSNTLMAAPAMPIRPWDVSNMIRQPMPPGHKNTLYQR